MNEQQDTLNLDLSGFDYVEEAEPKPSLTPAGAEAEGDTLALANLNITQEPNAVLAEFNSLRDGYKKLAEGHGTLEARKKVAHERNLRQLTAAQQVANEFKIIDPEVAQGALAVIETRMAEDAQAREQRAAEEEALDRLEMLAASDPIQAQVMSQNILRPDAEGAYRENATKGLMLRNALAKFGVAREEQGIGLDILDFTVDILTTIIPGIRAEQMIDIIPGLETSILDKLWAPGVTRRSVGALWNMSMEDFTKFVNSDLARNLVNEARTFGYDSVSTQARLASTFVDGYSNDDYFMDGTEAVLTAAFAPGVVTASRIAKGGTLSLMASMGGRKQAEQLALQAMIDTNTKGAFEAATTTAVKSDELLASVQTTATNVTGTPPAGLSFATVIDEVFKRAQVLTSKLAAVERAPSLTPDEKLKAVEWVTQKAEKMTGRSEVLNVGTEIVTLSDGAQATRLIMQVGKKDGGLYASKAGAENAAARMGLAEFKVVEDTSGGFAIQFAPDLPENSFRVQSEPAGWNNPIKRFFGSSQANTPDDIQGIATMARGARRRIYEQITEPFTKSLQALGSTQRNALEQVAALGAHEAKWYTQDEFLFHYRRAHTPDKTLPSAGGETTFTTAKGSTYKVGSDGTTVRDKKARPEHPGEEGVQPKSERTVYLDEQEIQKLAIIQAKGGSGQTKVVFDDKTNSVAVSYATGKDAGKIIPDTVTSYSKTPQVGLHPVEVWKEGSKVHFGNKITSVSKTAPTPTKSITVAQEKEAIAAYQKYIDSNDMEWIIDNDIVYRQLKDDRFETVTLATPRGQILNKNARIDEDFDNLTNALKSPESTGEFRIYNATDDIHYTERNALTAKDLTKLRNDGFVLVKMQESTRMADDTYVQYILVKKGELKRRPIDRIQLPYSPGGHRFYADKYVVKRAQRAKQGDTGRQVLLSPKAYRFAPTPAAGKQWAGTMNEAMAAAKAGASSDVINEIFEKAGTKGFPSADEFLDDFNKGSYGDGDDLFEVVFDRELPSAYTTGGVNPADFLDEVNNRNSSAGVAAVHGRMYYGHKGDEVMRDVSGDLATVIDPFTAMERGLNNVARTSSLYEYRTRAIEQWVKTFGPDLERYSPNQSQLEVFLHGKPKDSVTFPHQNQINAQREAIKRVLRFQTREEQVYEQGVRQFAEWVMGDATSGVRAKTGKFLLDQTDKSITGTIRSAVFDMTLGLFNVAQLPLQISTSIAAVTLSPKNGLAALTDIMTLRFIRNQAARDPDRLGDYINTITQNGTHRKNGFTSAKEYKEFLRYSGDSGLFNLNDSHTLVDNFGSSAAYSTTGKLVDRFRDAGRFFFNEAEYVNQFTAYGIAWREIRQTRPDLDFMSPAFKQEVARRTQDYGFRMMDESQAGFQRGLLSLPTQFWAYPIRMIESMTGRQFTVKQRMQLVFGQSLFWGAAGLPGMSLISDKITAKTGETPELGTVGSLATRGLVDNILMAAFDADVTVGRRIGVGGFFDEMALAIMGENSFGQVAPINLALGASASILGNTTRALWDLAKWQSALAGNDQNLDLTDTPAIEKLARQITSVNNTMNAYYGFKYGKLVSRNGTEVADIDAIQAGFAAFGIPAGQFEDISNIMSYNKNKKEKVASAVKVLNQLDDEWKRDPSKFEENRKLAELFMAIQPEEWKDEIRRQHNMAARSKFDTLHAGLKDRLEKDIEQREQSE